MATIPVVWVITILAVLAASTLLSRRHMPLTSRIWLAVGLGSLAIVSAILGLRLDYGLTRLAQIQPHVSVVLAPALWLGFRCLTDTNDHGARPFWIAGAVIALAQVALLLPLGWLVDLVVLAVNALFAVLMGVLLRQPPDKFVHVAPGNLRGVRIGLACAMVFLVLIIASDASIFVAVISAGDVGLMRFLSGSAGVLTLCVLIGVLVAVPAILGGPQTATARAEGPTPARDHDRVLFDRIEEMMANSRIFVDPNLTLARLGRRLAVPARDVSAAVNRVTGDNISRYINGHRVRHAAELLGATDLPVTDVMLEAGFQSKSTFNTEFRRLMEQTPSDYRKAARGRAQVRKRDPERSKP